MPHIEIQYRPHSDSTNQVDLCVAKAVLDRDNIEDRGKMVPFLFNHTLSCVTFSANYDDEELAVGINPMVPYSL